MAVQEKDKGNVEFQKGNYKQAIAHYSTAIDLDPKNAVFYSNRSASYYMLEEFEKAVLDADTGIKVNPEWPKVPN